MNAVVIDIKSGREERAGSALKERISELYAKRTTDAALGIYAGLIYDITDALNERTDDLTLSPEFVQLPELLVRVLFEEEYRAVDADAATYADLRSTLLALKEFETSDDLDDGYMEDPWGSTLILPYITESVISEIDACMERLERDRARQDKLAALRSSPRRKAVHTK